MNNKDLIRRLLKSLYPFRKKITLIILSLILSTILNFILPIMSKNVMDSGFLNKDYNLIFRYSILTFVIVLIDQLLIIAQKVIVAHLSNMYSYRWTSNALRKLMKVRISYIKDKDYNEVINNIRFDISNVSKITDQYFVFRILAIFRIIGGLAGLIFIDYKLSILIILTIPLKYLITSYFTSLRKDNQEKLMSLSSDYSRWYGDKLSGLKEIKLSALDNIVMNQFTNLQRQLIKTDIRSQLIDGLSMVLDIVFIRLITLITYIAGAFLLVRNSISLGSLFAFLTYSAYVIEPISSLINIKYDFVKIFLSAKRLFLFLDMDSEKNNKNSMRIDKNSIKGNIEFKNVSFSYDCTRKVLNNVSFEINQGEKVGIVGLNGAGKTTILNILLKLIHLSEGQVYLDGIDIKNINYRDIRRTVALVSQDSYLFNTTLKENISLFQHLEDVQLNKAIDFSEASELIEKLPGNIETVVGVNGSKLSGGERQRILLARAIAKDCKIIILDEATSNSDIEYEKKLDYKLINNLGNCTLIVITHKPYILKELDKIIVLDNGNVVDVGKHDELLKRNKTYIQFNSQYK